MTTTNRLTLQSIQQQLAVLLNDMIQEWDIELLDPIGAETRLIADLGFESVDLMQLRRLARHGNDRWTHPATS